MKNNQYYIWFHDLKTAEKFKLLYSDLVTQIYHDFLPRVRLYEKNFDEYAIGGKTYNYEVILECRPLEWEKIKKDLKLKLSSMLIGDEEFYFEDWIYE